MPADAPGASGEALSTVGAPLPLSGPAQPVQVYGRQSSIRVTRGPNGSLVTWLDQRTSGSNWLFAARLSPSGQNLDPGGIYLGNAAGGYGGAPAAWDGREWVIVASSSVSLGTVAITVRRLAEDGTPVDAVPKVLAQTSFVYKGDPSIACVNNNCLVAWTERYNSIDEDVLGLRYDSWAHQTVGSTLSIAVATASQADPQVATDGQQFLVGWVDTRRVPNQLDRLGDVYAARYPLSGSTPLPAPDGGAINILCAASSGGIVDFGLRATGVPDAGFYVAFDDVRSSSNGAARGTRVTSAGVGLDGCGLLYQPTGQTTVTPDWDGTGWAIGFYAQQERRHRVARVATDGGMSSNAPVTQLTAADFFDQFAAFGCFGTDCSMVWTTPGQLEEVPTTARFAPNSDLRMARVAADNGASDAGTLVLAPPPERAPAVAWDGTRPIVVWESNRLADAGWEIWAGAVRYGGPAGIAAPVRVGVAAPGAVLNDPSVACAPGGPCLVAWEAYVPSDGGSTVNAAWFNSTLDAGAFALTADGRARSPRVAWTGSRFYAAWFQGSTFPSGVYSTRFSTTGNRLDPSPVYLDGGRVLETIAASGEDVLLGWFEFPGAQGRAAIIPGDGGAPIFTALHSTNGSRSGLAAAGNGTHFLVGWTESSVQHTVLLNRDGTFAGPDQTTSISPTNAYFPDLALAPSDGGWSSLASQSTGEVVLRDHGPQGQYAGTQAVLETQATSMPGVALLQPAGAPGIAVFSAVDRQPGSYVPRLFFRALGPPGTPCTTGASCPSGFCVDGVCCDTSCGGNVTTDCLACSVAAGAAVDGICALLGSAHVCRDSAGPCDPAETCDGVSNACPPDVQRAAGAACDDGSACTLADTCMGAACAGMPKVCTPPPCQQAASCVPATGQCTFVPVMNGTSCDDGNACTVGDSCNAGACTGGAPVSCPPLDACHPGVCNSMTGACTTPPAPDNTACDDNNLCTLGERCVSGVCTPTGSRTCTPGVCQDTSGCSPDTGACSYSPKPDGTACPGGSCIGGTCIPADAGNGDAGLDGGATDGGPRDGGTDGGSADAGGSDAGAADGGGDAGSSDAGALDAGAPDGGRADGGGSDGGGSDAGTGDAGQPDAGAFDAGSPDGGSTTDAGNDAGAPDADAGALDAGATDAGATDAGSGGGTPSDGGMATDGGEPPGTVGGCGCGSTGAPGPLLLLFAAVLLRRRSRGEGAGVLDR